MINCIIPARGGSKGVPNKNIALVGSHPLIAYSIVAAKLCSMNRIIVSTDSRKIAEIAIKYGAEVPFLRPSELATDLSTDLGFLKHYFDNIEGDEVALIRPTSPFRNPKFMIETVGFYKKYKTEMTGLRSVERMPQPAYKQVKIKNGFFEELFQGINHNAPRQTLPATYSPNGHIDIVKRETVNNEEVFGDLVCAIMSDKTIDIDDIDDLKLANLMVGSEFDVLTEYIIGENNG